MTHLMKIVLCGDDTEGVNHFRNHYGREVIGNKQGMTIGTKSSLYETVVDNLPIKFQIWAPMGQQRFGAVRSVYYLGSLGAVFFYDVHRKTHLKTYRTGLKKYLNIMDRELFQ